MSKPKHPKVIGDVRKALKIALSDGTISKATFSRLNVPGLEAKKPFIWGIGEAPSEPQPEPGLEDRDAVVADASLSEVPKDISCVATPEEALEADSAAIAPDQVEPNSAIRLHQSLLVTP